MAVGAAPMQGRTFGESMSRAFRAPPPLRQLRNRCVMQRHLGVDPPDLPTRPAQPLAKLRLLARDQVLAVAAHLLEIPQPHQRIPAAGQRLADRRVPFAVTEPVIDRSLRVPLASATTDHHGTGVVAEALQPARHPARHHLAIAIDELDVIGRCARCSQRKHTGIARPRRREGARKVKPDHNRACPPRQRLRAIGRAAVDIDQPPHLAFERGETGGKPVPLIAADHHGINDRSGWGRRVPSRRDMRRVGCHDHHA